MSKINKLSDEQVAFIMTIVKLVREPKTQLLTPETVHLTHDFVAKSIQPHQPRPPRYQG